jgi:glycosyltransferase involved in cell wall biosynthesis
MANEITIIVPSFKRPRDLRRCLEAVAAQSRAADEVLVIGREDDTETSEAVCALQGRMPALRLVLVREAGLVAAMNRGLDTAKGDFVVFTDDDAEAQADWLERIEAKFADPSVGAVGGRDWIQLPDEPDLFQPSPAAKVGILTWYGALRGNHHSPLRGHTKRVVVLKGVNMAFRRRVLGSYRVDINLRGMGTQTATELDVCSQVRKAGFQLWFDDRILVKHYCSRRATDETIGDVENNRGPLTEAAIADISFNYHYLIAKHFGIFRALIYFSNARLLGSRSTPGLLAGVKWHFKGDRHVWRRSLHMARVGLTGFRAGRAARYEADENCAALKLDCAKD